MDWTYLSVVRDPLLQDILHLSASSLFVFLFSFLFFFLFGIPGSTFDGRLAPHTLFRFVPVSSIYYSHTIHDIYDFLQTYTISYLFIGFLHA